MILKIKENVIQRAFSRSAGRYRELAGLQERIGDDLILRIGKTASFRHILDVGMGPGDLTEKLKVAWPDAFVAGIDFASGMCARARHNYGDLRVIQADAGRLPFKDGTFDLVFSNLSYQWVDDLERAFSMAHAALKPDGLFYLTVFTGRSLKELFVSLQKACGEGKRKSLTARRLPDQGRVLEAVTRAGFQVREAGVRTHKVYFADMMALLKWLKGIGANATPGRVYVGKETFSRAEAYYRQRFTENSRVYGSFEVITLEGIKPGRGDANMKIRTVLSRPQPGTPTWAAAERLTGP